MSDAAAGVRAGPPVARAGSRRSRLAGIGRLELLVLLGVLVVAGLARLPGLDGRGAWDADQGTDMRVLAAFVQDGEVPLLGPRTSIGTFHHGAAYYWLLAPAAALSGADPRAVTLEIALVGIAAVAATWWLGRLVGGPLAGAVAGLLAAVSPAAIDESVFIWNPNLVPAAAALAFGGAIVARRTGRARWWALAGGGAMVTMQCHVLGVVVVAPLAWAWVADVRGRRRTGRPIRGAVRGGAAALVIVAAGFVPLLVSELGHAFAEARAILDFVAHGGAATAQSLPDRLLMVGLRTVTWPVTGLLTDRVWASLVSLVAVVTLAGIAAIRPRRRFTRGTAGEARTAGGVRTAGGAHLSGMSGGAPGMRGETPFEEARPPVDTGAVRWLLGALAVSVVALALVAGSLAVIVRELPADHYHAFLDPIVLALVGAGVARVATLGRRGASRSTAHVGVVEATAERRAPGPVGIGGVAGGLVVAGLAALAITAWPPAVAPDGGWPLVDDAAARVLTVTRGAPILLDGIPPFKNANALRFPLEHRGAAVIDARDPEATATGTAPAGVLVCDPVFDAVVGRPCGGPAEAAWLADHAGSAWTLLARFEAGPRRVISVYDTGAGRTGSR